MSKQDDEDVIYFEDIDWNDMSFQTSTTSTAGAAPAKLTETDLRSMIENLQKLRAELIGKPACSFDSMAALEEMLRQPNVHLEKIDVFRELRLRARSQQLPPWLVNLEPRVARKR